METPVARIDLDWMKGGQQSEIWEEAGTEKRGWGAEFG